MFILKGYELKKNSELFSVIEKIREVVNNNACSVYKKLLAEEIETITDNYVLGYDNPAQNSNVYDVAVSTLNNKIAKCSSAGYTSKYNLSANLYIYEFEDKIYFELNRGRDIYDKALDRINGIKNISVVETFDFRPACMQEHKELWTRIREAKLQPVIAQLYPCGMMEKPLPESLAFKSPAERAERIARHQISTILLSQETFVQNPSPMQTMQAFDRVIDRLSEEPIIDEIKAKAKSIESVLPDITSELITEPFKMEATHNG